MLSYALQTGTEKFQVVIIVDAARVCDVCWFAICFSLGIPANNAAPSDLLCRNSGHREEMLVFLGLLWTIE